MKKLKSIIALLLAASVIVPFTAFSAVNGIKQNPEIELPCCVPTVDANITEEDNWSAPAKMNNDTVKYVLNDNKFSVDADVFFAYSNEGFYFAADIHEFSKVGDEITDDSFVFSTGEDDLDLVNGENVCGYNGDVFIIALDPLGKYQQAGYLGTTDYTAWYCVGLFEDGAKMYRTRVNNSGDITDDVNVSARVTKDGWMLEAFIPWNIIISDMDDASYGKVSYTVDELIAPGAQYRCAALYQDRFDDIETESVNTRGRYMTARTVMSNGTPSHLVTGDYSDLYGLNLYIGDVCPDFTDVTADSWYQNAVSYCYTRKYMQGISDTEFAPDMQLTREMFVTILANLAKADQDKYTSSSFGDVPTGKYYSKAVEWAYEKGLTSGIADGIFGTGKMLTREELAVFMTSFAKYTKKNTDGRANLFGFSDASDISGWARESMSWMVYKGFINGVGNNRLAPKTVATRAQTAVLVMNYMKEYGLNIFG